MQPPRSGRYTKRDGDQRHPDYHRRDKHFKPGLDHAQIGHQRRHGEMFSECRLRPPGRLSAFLHPPSRFNGNCHYRGLHRGEATASSVAYWRRLSA
jgi:hypothetical protein